MLRQRLKASLSPLLNGCWQVFKLCSDPWRIINVSLVVLNWHDMIHTNLDYINKHTQTSLAVIAINREPVNRREIASEFQLST